MLTDSRDSSLEKYSSTDSLYSSLDLDVNLNNDLIFQIIAQDPFKEILEKEPLLAIQEIKKQFEYLNENKFIPSYESVVPTCAEKEDGSDMIVLWRMVPKFIGGGNAYPFSDNNTAFLMKGKSVNDIRIDSYWRKGFLTNHPKILRKNSVLKFIKPETIDNIMLYESSPSAYPGYLVKAYKDIEKL